MADPFAMVKVGNSECEFLKLTPLSRTSAIAGAVCGVTILPRSPSGIKRIRLRGVAFCADAALADSVIRLAESSTIARRIRVSPGQANSAPGRLPCLVLLCDRNVTANCDRRGDGSPWSRGADRPALRYLPPKEGVGNAGCPVHPQPTRRMVGLIRSIANRVSFFRPKCPSLQTNGRAR